MITYVQALKKDSYQHAHTRRTFRLVVLFAVVRVRGHLGEVDQRWYHGNLGRFGPRCRWRRTGMALNGRDLLRLKVLSPRCPNCSRQTIPQRFINTEVFLTLLLKKSCSKFPNYCHDWPREQVARNRWRVYFWQLVGWVHQRRLLQLRNKVDSCEVGFKVIAAREAFSWHTLWHHTLWHHTVTIQCIHGSRHNMHFEFRRTALSHQRYRFTHYCNAIFGKRTLVLKQWFHFVTHQCWS